MINTKKLEAIFADRLSLRNLVGQTDWVTGIGERIKLRNMELGHLINCTTFVRKRYKDAVEAEIPAEILEQYKYQGYTYAEWEELFNAELHFRMEEQKERVVDGPHPVFY